MLKSYRVGWVVVVAHKILLSVPVPWIGDWGLGLNNLGVGTADYMLGTTSYNVRARAKLKLGFSLA